MTVGELIEELSKHPSKSKVVTEGQDLERLDTVDGVGWFLNGDTREVAVVINHHTD